MKAWICITDPARFNETWHWIQLHAPPSVVQYLTAYWMRPDVVKMWSAFYRTGFDIFQANNTNMLVEAWHHVLKSMFLHGRRNRRLDHLLHILVESVIPHYALKHRRQQLGFQGIDLEEQKRLQAIEKS
ncbi:hypothetical protein C8F01DRAFT_1001090, partial [Mycena amicta]